MNEHTRQTAVAALLSRRILDSRRPPTPATLKVARYVENNPGLALTRSAADLAREIGLSDATVIRAVQSLGFEGMAALRDALAAILEGGSPGTRMERTFGVVGANTARAIELTLAAHQEAVGVLQSEAVRKSLQAAVGIMSLASRIVVFGIGPSAMLARYAALLLVRVGRDARTLDCTGSALADQLLETRAGDAILLLAYGKAYPEISATMAQARRLRLPMVLVSDSLSPRLARHAEVIVPVPRGRAEQVALHGATLVALEAMVLGLAATDRPRHRSAAGTRGVARRRIGPR